MDGTTSHNVVRGSEPEPEPEPHACTHVRRSVVVLMATTFLSVIAALIAVIAGFGAWPLLILAALALAACSGMAVAAWPKHAAAITVAATGLITAITLAGAWIISS